MNLVYFYIWIICKKKKKIILMVLHFTFIHIKRHSYISILRYIKYFHFKILLRNYGYALYLYIS